LITGYAQESPFADTVMRAVNTAIGFDGYCLFAVDPITGLRCAMYSENALKIPTWRLVLNETVENDYNRYTELTHRPGHAGVLAQRVAPEPASPRLHEILRPEGFRSELRLVLVDGGRYWGALSLFRDELRHPFTDTDLEAAADLAGPLAVALRRDQVRRTGPAQDARAAGIVLVGTDGRFLHISPEAQGWLGNLASDGVSVDDISRVVYEVAFAASSGKQAALSRARTADGGWLVVSGTKTPVAPVDVTVVIQPASVGQVLPALAAWTGLSRREFEVLQLVAAGLAAKQIAKRLNLSVLTVNDHLRATYRKAGVSGREELLALMN
jgi:DNA-binding CsgD family transcriptional regulator